MHSRSMRRSSAAMHLAVAMLALAAGAAPAVPGSSGKGSDPLQLARASQTYRSHWSDTSDDKGAELDRPLYGSKKSGGTGGAKSDAGGYSSQRVRRFWSHYHGAPPGPKEKPLEKQPREGQAPPKNK